MSNTTIKNLVSQALDADAKFVDEDVTSALHEAGLAFLATLQQPHAGGEVEFRARLVTAVALDAMLLEHGTHIGLEQRQPLRHGLGVFFRDLRRGHQPPGQQQSYPQQPLRHGRIIVSRARLATEVSKGKRTIAENYHEHRPWRAAKYPKFPLPALNELVRFPRPTTYAKIPPLGFALTNT